MKKRTERIAYFILGGLFSGVMSFAKSGAVTSLSLGYLVTAILCGFFALPTAIGYIASHLLIDFSFWCAVECAVAIFISTIFSFLFRRRKKEITALKTLVVCLLAQLGSIVRAVVLDKPFFFTLANIIVALSFSYATFLAMPKKRRVVESELSYAGKLIVLSVFYCAVSVLGAEYLLLLPTCFLLGKAHSKSGALACALAVGVGQALHSFSPTFIALSTFAVAVGAIFLSLPRPLTVLGSVMAVIVFRLYFIVDTSGFIVDLALLTVGGAFYCVLPKRAIEKLAERSVSRGVTPDLRFMLAIERENYASRLIGLGACFYEMQRAILMSITPIVPESVKRRLIEEVCSRCNACNGECLNSLCSAVSKKERADASDAPELLAVGCPHSARIFALANEIASNNAYYKQKSKADETLKREVAFHLESVASLISKSGQDSLSPLSFDREKEVVLTEELRNHGFEVIDCVIKKGDDEEIVIAFLSMPPFESLITAVDLVMEAKYYIKRKTREAQSGRYVLLLKEKPPYEVVFSASSVSKSDLDTGDKHSFIKIGERKFMMALCDGMGSGKKAGAISETAVELVESYFRAGFSGEFIVYALNRFLSKQNGESFTAFDILVCDLFSLERTIIKLGSPRSFIKQTGGIITLDGNALPLGVVEEITPFIRKDYASEGESVTFVSDGVSDAFSGNDLGELVLDSDERNAKNYTERILSEAKRRKKGKIDDDMTVTTARIVRRI